MSAKYQRIVHEGLKYPCRQCNYQATTKGSLVELQSALHEGLKHPCRHCNYEATTKGSLGKHQRAVHEGKNILADNATIKQLQKEVLPNTREQYTKD